MSVEDPDPVVIDLVMDPDTSVLYIIIISSVKYKRNRNYISKLIILSVLMPLCIF